MHKQSKRVIEYLKSKTIIFDDISHKNLWNFILSSIMEEQKLDLFIKRDKIIDLYDLKSIFFKINKIDARLVSRLCFSCQYAKELSSIYGLNKCSACPFLSDVVDVKSKKFSCLNGLYPLAEDLFSTLLKIRRKIIESNPREEDTTLYELSSRYVQSALIKIIEKIRDLPIRKNVKLASDHIFLFKLFKFIHRV